MIDGTGLFVLRRIAVGFALARLKQTFEPGVRVHPSETIEREAFRELLSSEDQRTASDD